MLCLKLLNSQFSLMTLDLVFNSCIHSGETNINIQLFSFLTMGGGNRLEITIHLCPSQILNLLQYTEVYDKAYTLNNLRCECWQNTVMLHMQIHRVKRVSIKKTSSPKLI